MSFAKQVRQYMRQGYDQNQATALAMGMPADGPPKPPAPPKPAPVPKAPVQAKATQASVGQGVRQNKRAKRRTKVSDLRISRQPAAQVANANFAGGSGLNIGGY